MLYRFSQNFEIWFTHKRSVFHIFVFFLLYMHASVSIAFDVLHVHVTYRYQCREWDAAVQCSQVYTSKNTTKLNSTIICICCNFLGMTWFLLCHHDNFKFQFVPNIKNSPSVGCITRRILIWLDQWCIYNGGEGGGMVQLFMLLLLHVCSSAIFS